MEETKNLKLVFVSPVIENQKTGTYIYKFYYSENPDVVWGNYWDYDNPSIADEEDIFPQESSYSYTEDVKSDYKLGLAMKNACYPMLYCTNTTVQKHQFFGTQLSSQSNSHIHT